MEEERGFLKRVIVLSMVSDDLIEYQAMGMEWVQPVSREIC